MGGTRRWRKIRLAINLRALTLSGLAPGEPHLWFSLRCPGRCGGAIPVFVWTRAGVRRGPKHTFAERAAGGAGDGEGFILLRSAARQRVPGLGNLRPYHYQTPACWVIRTGCFSSWPKGTGWSCIIHGQRYLWFNNVMAVSSRIWNLVRMKSRLTDPMRYYYWELSTI